MNKIPATTPSKPAAIPLKAAARELGISYEHAWDAVRRTGELLPGVKALRINSRWFVARAPFERALGIHQDDES
jgi:hypothetical protein